LKITDIKLQGQFPLSHLIIPLNPEFLEHVRERLFLDISAVFGTKKLFAKLLSQ